MKKHNLADYAIPLVIVAAISALSLTDFFTRLEGSVYNTLLHVKPPIEEHESILLVDYQAEPASAFPVRVARQESDHSLSVTESPSKSSPSPLRGSPSPIFSDTDHVRSF